MISIDYKDTQTILDAFVKDVKVDLPIILDLDSAVSKKANIFAFPSRFLVDVNSLILYNLNTGSIWNSPEMLDYQKEMMAIEHQACCMPKPIACLISLNHCCNKNKRSNPNATPLQ